MVTVLVSADIFITIMFAWWIISRSIKKARADDRKIGQFQIWFIATLQIILLLLADLKFILTIIK